MSMIGGSQQTELEGAKRCFAYLQQLGLSITIFVSDCHRGIAKWIRKTCVDAIHYFDIWHVARSLSKKPLSLVSTNQRLDKRYTPSSVLECNVNQRRLPSPYCCKMKDMPLPRRESSLLFYKKMSSCLANKITLTEKTASETKLQLNVKKETL